MDGSVHPPTASAAEAAAARPGRQRALLCRLGEELAAAHFGRLGFTVLERNVRSRSGEIDMIAFDGRTLVFVEVIPNRCRRVLAAGVRQAEGEDGQQERPARLSVPAL